MAKSPLELPQLDPIWPCGKKIKVLGITGPINSGKTMFGLLIDPEHTLVVDTEDSSATYDSGAKDASEALGINRIDLYEILTERKKGSDFTPLEIYKLFEDRMKAVPPGKYSVIMVDVWSDIEAGAVEYIKSRYSDHGFSSAEKFISTGGIFWEKVNSHLKKLINEIKAKCQTFVFVVHLKKEWKDGKPTKNVIPKGKVPLMESASLYLYLEREPNDFVPSAIPLKARLASFKKVMVKDPETGNMKPKTNVINFLPKRIPVATPDAIRNYILNPPDINNPKEGEICEPRILAESEKLELQKEIEERRIEAATIELESRKIDQVLHDAKSAAKDKLKGRKTKQAEQPESDDSVSKADSNKQETLKQEKQTKTKTSGREVHKDEALSAAETAEKLKINDKLYRSVVKTLTSDGIQESEIPSELSKALRLLSTKKFHTVLDWLDTQLKKNA